MVSTDAIADMIIRLKNAGMAGKDAVQIPYSKMKQEICSLLEKQGFIKSVSKKGKKTIKTLDVELLYRGSDPRITGVKRLSKPSRRMYVSAKEIRPVKRGFGTIVLSTPKGILTGVEAKKEKIGGEALFEIW